MFSHFHKAYKVLVLTSQFFLLSSILNSPFKVIQIVFYYKVAKKKIVKITYKNTINFATFI